MDEVSETVIIESPIKSEFYFLLLQRDLVARIQSHIAIDDLLVEYIETNFLSHGF